MHFGKKKKKKDGKKPSFTLNSHSIIIQWKPALACHMYTSHGQPLNTNHLHICVLSISEPVDLWSDLGTPISLKYSYFP